MKVVSSDFFIILDVFFFCSIRLNVVINLINIDGLCKILFEIKLSIIFFSDKLIV